MSESEQIVKLENFINILFKPHGQREMIKLIGCSNFNIQLLIALVDEISIGTAFDTGEMELEKDENWLKKKRGEENCNRFLMRF